MTNATIAATLNAASLVYDTLYIGSLEADERATADTTREAELLQDVAFRMSQGRSFSEAMTAYGRELNLRAIVVDLHDSIDQTDLFHQLTLEALREVALVAEKAGF